MYLIFVNDVRPTIYSALKLFLACVAADQWPFLRMNRRGFTFTSVAHGATETEAKIDRETATENWMFWLYDLCFSQCFVSLLLRGHATGDITRWNNAMPQFACYNTHGSSWVICYDRNTEPNNIQSNWRVDSIVLSLYYAYVLIWLVVFYSQYNGFDPQADNGHTQLLGCFTVKTFPIDLYGGTQGKKRNAVALCKRMSSAI